MSLRTIAVVALLIVAGSHVAGSGTAAAAANANARPGVGVSTRLWQNKSYRLWLKRFRQNLQRNLLALQHQEALGARLAEQQRRETLRRAQDSLDDAMAMQRRLLAERAAYETARLTSCLATCAMPAPCGPGTAGTPASSCPTSVLKCQLQCR